MPRPMPRPMKKEKKVHSNCCTYIGLHKTRVPARNELYPAKTFAGDEVKTA